MILITTAGKVGAEAARLLAAQGEPVRVLARQWGETPLILSAMHDRLGHVAINVQIETNVYREPSWEARATVHLEAGRLDHVARDAAELPSLLASA